VVIEARKFSRIGIVGMGYVGLTLTAALARAGYEVHGVEIQPKVLNQLSRGKPHIFEPGITEIFEELIGKRIMVASELPRDLVDAAIICVSTPVDPITHQPYLGNLASAAEHIAERCSQETLVVVRSTVPVGTSREVVLPPLVKAWGSVYLIMAPERTIQGKALSELVELPQVVGGVDDLSLKLGLALFGGLAKQVVPVSSLETAELVKLTNNCHTDVIYAFGNEVAGLTERLGLDPLEVIRAANLDYPRPDVAKPGYVGGGCLSKDPYIMLHAAERSAYQPKLIGAARALNEDLPVRVALRIAEMMRAVGGRTLTVLGWAYKGWPPTDDTRGTPIAVMMPVFQEHGINVLGHDPIVSFDVIREYGGEPVELERGFHDADALLVITDHPDYRNLDLDRLLVNSRLRIVYDSWRILDEARITAGGVQYASLGYEPAARRFSTERVAQ
jgi:UDP-N-acetyl-D-mannosaminuronic acid dehydrogenase